MNKEIFDHILASAKEAKIEVTEGKIYLTPEEAERVLTRGRAIEHTVPGHSANDYLLVSVCIEFDLV